MNISNNPLTTTPAALVASEVTIIHSLDLENEDKISSKLLEIITAMSGKYAIKQSCELLASEALGTCRDRTSLALNSIDTNVSEVALGDVLERVKNAVNLHLL